MIKKHLGVLPTTFSGRNLTSVFLKWSILPKRLPQQLLKLQELNFLTFETATGKAPLITSVRGDRKI